MRFRSAATMAVIAIYCAASPFLRAKRAWADETPVAEQHKPPTLDQIIEGIERTESLFFDSQSLLIRYERRKSTDFIPSPASGGGGLLPAEWTLAYKGGKWYSERRFTKPMQTKDLLVPSKPKTQVVKDRFLVEWDQHGMWAAVMEFKEGHNIYTGLDYIRILSLDAPKRIARSNGTDIVAIRKIRLYADDVALPFLPEFLIQNKAHYQVLSTPEEVDGALCWVVQWPGMDRFWVDPKRGFAIPRRAYSWAPGKPLRFAFRQRDYREVKPGLWLPFSQIEDKYANIAAEKESLRGKVAVRSEYRLNALEFDNLSDSFFDVQLPPGTRVNDEVRKFQYAISDNTGTDPFAPAIAEANRLRRSSFWRWLSVGALVVAFVVGALVLFSRVRARKQPGIA